MLTFVQKKPHPQLADYIRSYWLVEGDDTDETLALVPDGYPELFFVLSGSLRMQQFSGEKTWQNHDEGGLIGQASGRFAFESAARTRLFCVKLYPWTPHGLFGVPTWQLNNAALEISALSTQPDHRQLTERVQQAAHLNDIVALLDTFFLQKIPHVKSDDSAFLRHAIRQIYASHGTVGMDDLTRQVRASRRYVEKIFREKIGLAPKQYARIIRVKKASMYLLDPRCSGQVREIVHRLDYYDQSHLLKDFRAIVGQTPTEFLRGQLNFSDDTVRAYLDQWDYS
jgi:AraC-like DNA-binding protein